MAKISDFIRNLLGIAMADSVAGDTLINTIDAKAETEGTMRYIGELGCSTNPDYPAAISGDTYYINVDGKIGGNSGILVYNNSYIICKISTASGDQAAVGSNWRTISDVPIEPTNPSLVSTLHAIPRFTGISGLQITDSKLIVAYYGNVSIPAGKKYNINGSSSLLQV